MCKCVFDLIPYNSPLVGAGVSARLKMVQVIELVSKNSADNLLKEEEGYVTEKVQSNNNEVQTVQTNTDF
jgi:hypothetical protein